MQMICKLCPQRLALYTSTPEKNSIRAARVKWDLTVIMKLTELSAILAKIHIKLGHRVFWNQVGSGQIRCPRVRYMDDCSHAVACVPLC